MYPIIMSHCRAIMMYSTAEFNENMLAKVVNDVVKVDHVVYK